MNETFVVDAVAAALLLASTGGFVLGRRTASRRAQPAEPVRRDPSPPLTFDAIPPETLLGRSPQIADVGPARRILTGADVLVTGAGGSIGSELCRQVADLAPHRLILLGHGENSLFAIHRELLGRGIPGEMLRVVLADVADAARVRAVFARERPHVVFHAAAHKHVPLCEDNVCEAVRNNVLGTRVLAMAAAAAGTAKFVLVSTDKAVNPTNVMGATKRLAETICQSFETRTATEFVSVRFGNVLGSRGSVVPIFAEQVAAGGPVTITDRRMSRYFMTIPEAVSLILAAGAIARDGHLCVLDMGEAVSVLGLAERLIRAMGREPYTQIPIVETGLRPGEKLYEELLTDEEGLSKTSIDRVFLARHQRIDYGAFGAQIDKLVGTARCDDAAGVVRMMAELVPSFTPGEHWAERDVRGLAIA